MKTTNMILWLSLGWLPLMIYAMLGNETKFKKNIAVGVTFPQAGREDPEVLVQLKKFRTAQRRLCLALVALAVVGAFLPWGFGWTMTAFLIWVDLCVILPYLPYVRCNKALRRIKADRGWGRQGEGRRVTVDLRSAATPVKELSLGHFLLPTLVALIPCLWCFWQGETALALTLLLNAVLTLSCYLLYRYALRRRSEVVDDNTDLTEVLTRLRRQHWRRLSLWTAWYLALLSLCMWGTSRRPFLGMTALAALTLALLFLVLRQEFSLRRMQEKLTADSGVGEYVDEDDKWLWGLFYYDPHDSRLIVNNRVGGNTTVNLARRAGQVFMGLTAALLLFLPLIGVWLVQVERTPVTVTVEGETLVARHMGTRYAVDLEDIETVTLVEERPRIVRIVGTGMDSVQKGSYSSEAWGPLTACLDPRTGPWLLVETGEKTYLLGDSQAGEAEEVYRQLEHYGEQAGE